MSRAAAYSLLSATLFAAGFITGFVASLAIDKDHDARIRQDVYMEAARIGLAEVDGTNIVWLLPNNERKRVEFIRPPQP